LLVRECLVRSGSWERWETKRIDLKKWKYVVEGIKKRGVQEDRIRYGMK
jgi:hypothetical protein